MESENWKKGDASWTSTPSAAGGAAKDRFGEPSSISRPRKRTNANAKKERAIKKRTIRNQVCCQKGGSTGAKRGFDPLEALDSFPADVDDAAVPAPCDSEPAPAAFFLRERP